MKRKLGLSGGGAGGRGVDRFVRCHTFSFALALAGPSGGYGKQWVALITHFELRREAEHLVQ